MTIQTFAAGQTLTASQMNTLQASDFNFTKNVQTGTAYTLVITDRGKLLEFSNAGSITLTVPTNAAVAFEIGDRVDVLLVSNGSIAITGASGVTVAAEGGLTTISSQWTRVTLIKRTTDDWVITGGSAEVQTAEIEDGAITEVKLATGAVTSAKILNETIVNEDISASAAIVDTKLATISTVGKVANSATSASDDNFADSIVSRDASGNFAAGTITADLIGDVTGTITGNITGNLTGNVTGNLTGNVTGISTYTAEWTLGANGTANYLFTGPGLTGAENDPTIYLTRGQKYKFTNTMGSHPFRIQSTVNGSTGTAYSDGVTNNDVSNGTLIFDVQFDAPSVLYYQNTSQANMGGKIYIVNEGVASDASVSTSGTITAAGFVGPITGNVTGNVTGDVTGTASNASKIGNRTVYVQQGQPSVSPVTGDIWFQVTGIAPL